MISQSSCFFVDRQTLGSEVWQEWWIKGNLYPATTGKITWSAVISFHLGRNKAYQRHLLAFPLSSSGTGCGTKRCSAIVRWNSWLSYRQNFSIAGTLEFPVYDEEGTTCSWGLMGCCIFLEIVSGVLTRFLANLHGSFLEFLSKKFSEEKIIRWNMFRHVLCENVECGYYLLYYTICTHRDRESQ